MMTAGLPPAGVAVAPLPDAEGPPPALAPVAAPVEEEEPAGSADDAGADVLTDDDDGLDVEAALVVVADRVDDVIDPAVVGDWVVEWVVVPLGGRVVVVVVLVVGAAGGAIDGLRPAPKASPMAVPGAGFRLAAPSVAYVQPPPAGADHSAQ